MEHNDKEREGWSNVSYEPDGKRQLGRPRCRREDNVRIDLREIW
jgi:hypothetical protein